MWLEATILDSIPSDVNKQDDMIENNKQEQEAVVML